MTPMLNYTQPTKTENNILLFSALECSNNPFIDEMLSESVPHVRAWGYVVRLLIHHGTLITFNHHMKRLHLMELIPDQVKEDLHIHEAMVTHRNKRYRDAIKLIAVKSSETELPIVFIKGAQCIIAGYYPEGNRFMGDIDIIVPENRIKDTIDMLTSLGYMSIDPENNTLRYQIKKELEFKHQDDRELIVEIASQLVKNRELLHCYPFNSTNLFDYVSRISHDGVSFAYIEKEFHFTYCLYHHAALNYMYRLNWLNDLYRMLIDPQLEHLKVDTYIKKFKLINSFAVVITILTDQLHIDTERRLAPSNVSIPRCIRTVYTDQSCAWCDVQWLELHEALIRLALIKNFIDKIKFILFKAWVTPQWLRYYYHAHTTDSIIRLYIMHYMLSIQRLVKKQKSP